MRAGPSPSSRRYNMGHLVSKTAEIKAHLSTHRTLGCIDLFEKIVILQRFL